MTDFATLKANVASAIGRSDVPAYIYDLATAEINARLRLREMELEAAITADAATEALPGDFMQARALWHDNDRNTPLEAVSEFGRAVLHDTGVPQYYAISGGNLRLAPVPDGTYPLRLRYVARLAPLVGDSDNNAVLVSYPAVYLYAALKHAAIWAQDQELAASYAAAFEGETRRVERQDMTARYPGPLVRRARATP